MNKEDYFKYYIQGSDHYLIPKDVFKELFNEMSNWRDESKQLKEVIEEIRKTLKLERKTALSLNQAYTVSVIDCVLQILDKGESNE